MQYWPPYAVRVSTVYFFCLLCFPLFFLFVPLFDAVFADLATSWLYVASNFLVLTHYLLSLYLSLRFTHMHTHTHTHTHTYTLAGFGHKRGSVQKMKLFNVKRLLSFSAGYT